MADAGQSQQPAAEALPKEVIILLCILGAGFITMMGYAVHRVFKSEQYSSDQTFFNNVSDEQSQYLKEVKERNLAAMGMNRGGGHHGYGYGDSRPPRGGRSQGYGHYPSGADSIRTSDY